MIRLHVTPKYSYDDAKEASSLAVNITATAYYDAKDNYNGLGLRFRWPAPYDLSEEERQVYGGSR